MSILDRFRRKNVLYAGSEDKEKPYIKLTDYDLPEAPPKKSSDYLKEYKNWLYPNINAIANPVSGIDFELYKLNSKDEVEEVVQHPVLELLDRCNPFMTAREVVFTYVQHRKLIGEACWFVERSGGETGDPTAIYPLRPDKITIQPGDISKNEFIKYYTYKSGADEIKISPENIVFFKDPNPENPYRGKGVIASADVIIDIDNFSREWQKNIMFNGGATGATFSTENQLTNEQITRIEAQLRKKYQGFNNAGKIVILEGGLKLADKNSNPKELDFNVSREKIRDEISAMFNNPKTVLGITDDVNRANAEATEYVHNKNVIKVEMEKLTDDLTEKLLPMFKGTENMFISFSDPVPQNKELDIQKYKQLVDVVYTRNEVREMEGLEPVEGGDFMYVAINQVPLGEEVSGEDSIPSKTIQMGVVNKMTDGQKLAKKYSKQVRKIKNKNVKIKLMQSKMEAALKNAIVNQVKETIAQKTADQQKQIDVVNKWTPKKKQDAFQNSVDKYDKNLQDKLSKYWYPALQKETLAYLNESAGKGFKRKSIDGYLFDETPAVQGCIKLSEPVMMAAAKAAGELGLEWIASENEFIFTESLKKLIEEATNKFATEATHTAREAIRKVISDGISEGKGIPDISKNVQAEFGKLKQYQAERISRTEIARGSNQSLLEGWKQSGVVEGKEWILDGNPCPFCTSMKQDFKGGILIDEPFYEKGSVISITDDEGNEKTMKLDYADTYSPPVHPNCMCTLEPVFTMNKSHKHSIEKAKELEKDLDELIEEINNG